MISREERQYDYHNIFKPLIIITASWQFSYPGNFYSSEHNHSLKPQNKGYCCVWGENVQLPVTQQFH